MIRVDHVGSSREQKLSRQISPPQALNENIQTGGYDYSLQGQSRYIEVNEFLKKTLKNIGIERLPKQIKPPNIILITFDKKFQGRKGKEVICTQLKRQIQQKDCAKRQILPIITQWMNFKVTKYSFLHGYVCIYNPKGFQRYIRSSLNK